MVTVIVLVVVFFLCFVAAIVGLRDRLLAPFRSQKHGRGVADGHFSSEGLAVKNDPFLLNAETPEPRKLAAGASGQFSPELLVPEKCNCILRVPLRPLHLGFFSITDPSGSEILRAAAKWKFGTRGEASPGPRIALTTPDGDTVLAQCGRAPAEDLPSEFELFGTSGERYAVLAREESEDRYVLTTAVGLRLYFWGTLDRHAMNVTRGDGTLVATTDEDDKEEDPCSNPPAQKERRSYELHVAPLMDVGLILSAMLCIDHLA